MERRAFFVRLSQHAGLVALGTGVFAAGCRGRQYGHVLKSTDKDMVGSHTAGAETWEPLIEESVGRLLGRQQVDNIQQVAAGETVPCRKRICFVGIENKSAEEIGDFREQITQKIDTCVNESQEFEVISRRFVEKGLSQSGLRPDDLFVPSHRRAFLVTMEKLDHPFDYLLFATVTSGTTVKNDKDYQRDYLLTLELIDIETGHADKDSAEIRKGYHKNKLGAIKNYGHK
jgi:hypothetical protein